MGIGAAIVVAGVVVSALTVLPIALGAFAKRLTPKDAGHAGASPAFARWGERITRHPVVATVAGLAILVALALPALHMNFGMPDDATKATNTTQRKAYDKLTEAFGPGFNGPLLLAIDLPAGKAQADAAMQRVARAVADTPGVLSASPASRNRAGTAAIVSATPTTSPQDKRTSTLIDHLRDDVLPAAVRGTGAKVYLGGATATFKDMSDKVASRLPIFIGAVVILSLLLLMAAFRSIWVPLISAGFNLLGIAAAYGAVTLVFNDGVGKGIVGLQETVPTVSFVPLMMFAILFGLSMDYNVFLLSRIREAYQEGDAPKESVVHGMARIAKVILVAGAIMTSVFAGFMLTPDAITKQMGFGLAVAILIDVLVVRMLVAPAVVTLLGDRAWTLPHWLDRVLPEIHLEGEDEVAAPAAEEERRVAA
jgi:RND superfamily putative drug exporter